MYVGFVFLFFGLTSLIDEGFCNLIEFFQCCCSGMLKTGRSDQRCVLCRNTRNGWYLALHQKKYS